MNGSTDLIGPENVTPPWRIGATLKPPTPTRWPGLRPTGRLADRRPVSEMIAPRRASVHPRDSRPFPSRNPARVLARIITLPGVITLNVLPGSSSASSPRFSRWCTGAGGLSVIDSDTHVPGAYEDIHRQPGARPIAARS